MAKRFIDTDIFKKGFMKGLEPAYKLLWLYLVNDCNHAGIYEVEMDIASLRIGCPVEEEIALKVFAGKVIPFDGGSKWFIPSFIEFQYVELKANNKAHTAIISILSKYGFLDENLKIIQAPSKPLARSLQATMDKDMEKEMDKDKEMDKEIPREEIFEIVLWPTFDDWWDAYDKKRERAGCEKIWKKFTQELKEKIIEHTTLYVKSTPQKKYRKDPLTYLHGNAWNDEIIDEEQAEKPKMTANQTTMSAANRLAAKYQGEKP